MAASASARVPETVQPAAAAWPPPPSRAHTFVAFRPPLVRTDSLQPPSASSRMVTEVSTPSICPRKAAMSSISSSVAPASSMRDRDTGATAIFPSS